MIDVQIGPLRRFSGEEHELTNRLFTVSELGTRAAEHSLGLRSNGMAAYRSGAQEERNPEGHTPAAQ